MIFVGMSLGGSRILPQILSGLGPGFSGTIVVVAHRHRVSEGELVELLQAHCPLPVSEALDKEVFRQGRVYVAPPDYHLMVEEDHFELSSDEPVNFARPSIDVLFDSAAEAFGRDAVGVLLTGASSDGARGLARIKEAGGTVIVQDPAEAECPIMPDAALSRVSPDHLCRASEIAAVLLKSPA
ncbi:MAG TPA: chemotaxis protein CheB [Opitutaceae bacterium]|jgi:two-component system chemotaxis response regulator CheB|nr:chemotaxis protein CheB [Opitutaceae bacterium]